MSSDAVSTTMHQHSVAGKPCYSEIMRRIGHSHYKIPHGIFLIEGTSIATDSNDNVYCFNRGNVPVLVFDSCGNFLRYFGTDDPFAGTKVAMDAYGNPRMQFLASHFLRPHMIEIDHEDHIWLVDDMANTVTKCDINGKRLMVLAPHGLVITDAQELEDSKGREFKAAVPGSGVPFNRPTDCAIHAATGDIFVTDGYGNSRVHRFTCRGNHILSFGCSGTGPGEFQTPHNITIDVDLVYVADRENSRVQIFTIDGTWVREIHAQRAVSVAVGPAFDGTRRILIAEMVSHSNVHRGPHLHCDLSKWDPNIGHSVGLYDVDKGTCIMKIGGPLPGEHPEEFGFPHCITTDSKGSIYCAEVSFVECGKYQKPHAREMVSLRKWVPLTLKK